MARTIGIGNQNFDQIITNDYFYVDKTDFIREWWENGDAVTLITRPRRFGKTLNMNMLERFLSIEYEGRGEVFEGLSIWKDEKYRRLQGTLPVISLSFADVKGSTFSLAREKMCMLVRDLYGKYDFLLTGGTLREGEEDSFRNIFSEMTDSVFAYSLKRLSGYLSRYYGQKVIILLDEYDTPLHEAWVNGYWQEMAEFVRGLFNSTFKTNPCLDRAVMTGITRSQIASDEATESIFSDLNNLEVVTTTSEKYQDSFGFTQQEVTDALAEYGLSDREDEVKKWYDGFTFGRKRDIYNPWSIINYLDKRNLTTYWANTSSNGLVDRLVRRGDRNVKMDMEELLKGGTLHIRLDEQIVFDHLEGKTGAIWSLLLASGYLRVKDFYFDMEQGRDIYDLVLTNREIRMMFEQMIEGWFKDFTPEYNDFIKAMLTGNVKDMNAYMNRVALETFSYFDSGKKPSGDAQPERFYHGFVLGLIVELSDRYVITSNRESGFGRYDVMLEPRQDRDGGIANDAIILEFKVRDPEEETLEETAREALSQIERQNYAAGLEAKGFPPERIRKYGFAFEGKMVLIKG